MGLDGIGCSFMMHYYIERYAGIAAGETMSLHGFVSFSVRMCVLVYPCVHLTTSDCLRVRTIIYVYVQRRRVGQKRRTDRY